MANWGYERGFVIEHDPTIKKRIDCKDCCHYDSSDKSCSRRGLYLPEDGYNSWRNCKTFSLEPNVSHYYEKQMMLERIRERDRKAEERKKKTAGYSGRTHQNEYEMKETLNDEGEKQFSQSGVQFVPGDLVRHKLYGIGTVVSCDFKHVTILFRDSVEPRTMSRFFCMEHNLLKPL